MYERRRLGTDKNEFQKLRSCLNSQIEVYGIQAKLQRTLQSLLESVTYWI